MRASRGPRGLPGQAPPRRRTAALPFAEAFDPPRASRMPTPCGRKTFFARSNPMVVNCIWTIPHRKRLGPLRVTLAHRCGSPGAAIRAVPPHAAPQASSVFCQQVLQCSKVEHRLASPQDRRFSSSRSSSAEQKQRMGRSCAPAPWPGHNQDRLDPCSGWNASRRSPDPARGSPSPSGTSSQQAEANLIGLPSTRPQTRKKSVDEGIQLVGDQAERRRAASCRPASHSLRNRASRFATVSPSPLSRPPDGRYTYRSFLEHLTTSLASINCVVQATCGSTTRDVAFDLWR